MKYVCLNCLVTFNLILGSVYKLCDTDVIRANSNVREMVGVEDCEGITWAVSILMGVAFFRIETKVTYLLK